MNTVLLIIIAALFALDSWSTYQVLQMGGTELNPLIRWMFTKLSRKQVLVLIKVVPLAVLVTVEATLGIPTWALIVVVGIYCLVCYSNMKVYNKMKSAQK